MGKGKKKNSRSTFTTSDGKRVTVEGDGDIMMAGGRIVTSDGTVIDNKVGNGGRVVYSEGDLDITIED